MSSYNTISTIYANGNIQSAFDEIKELRRSGVNQPITIKLSGDVHELAETPEIGPDISGITIESESGTEATLSGGHRISGFKPTLFNGINCFGAYIDEVKNGKWNFTDLYVDGERADFTRYPSNGGFHKIDIDNNEGQLFSGSSWMTVNKKDIPSDLDLEGGILSFCHYWVDEHTPIKSYDSETGRLNFKLKTRFNISGDIEYYFENIAYAFKNPNEWYLDRKNGMLYYIPRLDSQTPDNIEVYAPVLDKLFKINSSNIRFRNIKLAHTKGDYVSNESYASDSQAVSNADGAVSFENASNCSFENCKLVNFGVHGFTINNGCKNITLSKNYIYDGGGGGIKINGTPYGSDISSQTHDNTINDNVIRHCGRRHMAACGILIMHSYNNLVSHNEISDLYYTGISCGWVWGYSNSITRDNIIEYNHIYNLGQGLLSDMGGVYLLGAQPGTIVRNNLIHDIKSREYGGWALYTDEGSGFILLENNICYNTSDNSYHQHYGRMNTVRNNIFAFSAKELLKVSRFEHHLSIIFENNILFSKGSPIYGINENHIKYKTVSAAKNVIFDCEKDKPDMPDIDEESIIADPLFYASDKFDFSLKPDSPAFKLGFKSINVREIGVRDI